MGTVLMISLTISLVIRQFPLFCLAICLIVQTICPDNLKHIGTMVHWNNDGLDVLSDLHHANDSIKAS